MDESQIKFGDKIFIYGHYLEYLENFPERSYNSVLGYMTVGGFLVSPVETDIVAACVPGFVADFMIDGQLAVATPFNNVKMVDITEKLSLSPPLTHGCKVWMPSPTTLLQEHSPHIQI